MTTFSEALAAAAAGPDRPTVAAAAVDFSRLDEDRAKIVNESLEYGGGSIDAATLEQFYRVSGHGSDRIDLSDLPSFGEALEDAEDALEAAKTHERLARLGVADAQATLRTVQRARREAIRAHYSKGATATDLSEALGLSIARIYQICTGARR